MDPEEFFRKAGLKPRPLQLEVAKQLAEMLESGSVGLEAPTGFGKTITVLAAISLANAFPVTWRVRTYALARHIANQSLLFDLRPFIVAGRERTCPRAKELGPSLPFYCRYFRHKCSIFRSDLRNLELDALKHPVLSYEDLIDLIRGQACPYFSQMSVRADVYVTHYSNSLPLPSPEVVDEAHNVVKIQGLPLTRVREALAELGIDYNDYKELRYPRFFVEKSLPLILERLEKGSRLVSAPVLFNMLMGAETAWVEESQLFTLKIFRPKTPAIFISATLSPISKILRVPIIKVRQPRRHAFVATWLTTKFTDYDARMADRYDALIFLLRKYYGKIIVFATERVGALLHPTLSEDDLPLQSDWQGVLLLSPRGRWAEGVDVEADAVVLAGVPYPPPGTIKGLSPDDIVTIT
ncbi:hypothetical protein, partial [Thermofilum sp.]|uniref:hypothetical protein n=1 Tax=Thermofilum sp. TaxID=1961369 RepID=UPI00258F790E